MFKIINFKDKLYKEFIKSIVYRKLILCKDLNIEEGNYVHAEKKKINKMIQEYELNKGYLPTKIEFNTEEI
jgi:hypothetical protein